MKFSNSYVDLGERFYQKVSPTPVQAPKLLLFNERLAKELQLSEALLADDEMLAKVFSGNLILEGSEPIATVYAGHQFGQFNPQLGDGRAHLLGELFDGDGKAWDIQLKGSGLSAFSRSGDGRCALGPAVREYIMSEAMHALGVPTTLSLAVVATGEKVYRQSALPGAVVTRVASSHLRVGTFQFYAARQDADAVKALAEYAIERHFPEIQSEGDQRYIDLLDAVIKRQIHLVTQWMRVGFIHGVMNTDNTAISGETIDFGPCAMMGVYDPATVYSSIDTGGRYAFGNQPSIAQWNMARFAECLLLIVDHEDTAVMQTVQSLIHDFPKQFDNCYLQMMASKLGLAHPQENDAGLIMGMLDAFKDAGLDYTQAFLDLAESLEDAELTKKMQMQLGDIYQQWRTRIEKDSQLQQTLVLMAQNNPRVIPRNHNVEAVISECENTGNVVAALEFLKVLQQPYAQLPETEKYQQLDGDFDQRYQTFCGT